MAAAGVDRRSKRRYGMDLDLTYKLVQEPGVAGSGITRDLSRCGIFFSSLGRILPEESVLELSIRWPALLMGKVAVNLAIVGEVIRSSARGTAVRIQRYEFRTASRGPASVLLPFEIIRPGHAG
jgi:hypothetical protein